MTIRLATALVLSLLLPRSAVHAATQTVLGRQAVISDPRPGVDPTRRGLKGSAREPFSDDALVGNPQVAGAVLTFFAEGANSANQAFVLPAAYWHVSGAGYRYIDLHGANGPVKKAQIGRSANGTFQIKATASGRNGTILVRPPNPGTTACFRLQLVNGDAYDVLFGPGSLISRNDDRVFSTKSPPHEGTCGGGSSTTSTTATTTTHATTTATTTSTTGSTGATTTTTGATTSSSGATTTNTTTSTSAATSSSTTTSTTSGGTTTTQGGGFTRFSFQTIAGTSDCGGATATAPTGRPAAAPFSGATYNSTNTKVRDLGANCLYIGGGGNTSTPPNSNGAGSRTYLDITGHTGSTLTLSPSAGTSSANCSLGPLVTKHCANATATGCTADTNCPSSVAGSCQPDAQCFFGAPIPVAATVAACVINTIAGNGVSGTSDQSSGDTTLTVPLVSYTYLPNALQQSANNGGSGSFPCPQCLSGTCRGGKNDGHACTQPAAGTTTLECPPDDSQYTGPIIVTLGPLSTGAVSKSADPGTGTTSGEFCYQEISGGSRNKGAFGSLTARRIDESGVLPGALTDGQPHAGRLASIFCIPSGPNATLNSAADLPGPGAVSVTANFQLQ